MNHWHYGNYAPPHPIPPALPRADRGDYTVAGHWLLARLGKRVLRPGGMHLTRALLADAGVSNADVVEFAPGRPHVVAREAGREQARDDIGQAQGRGQHQRGDATR